MSKGYVYILSNPSMPGLLKIGKTTRTVEQRCYELWHTGVPTPFEVERETFSPDCHSLEATMHAALAKYRVSASREFFRCEVSEALSALDQGFVDQIYEFIDEYAHGLVLVGRDHMVDSRSITALADKMGVKPIAVSCAMDLLTPEELAPAMARLRAAQSNSGDEE